MTRGFDGRTMKAAILAGLAAAATVEVYLFALGLASWPGTYQWIASALWGPAAFAAASYAWIGVAMHLGVSLGWAVVWAAAAHASPRLRARPLAWGAGFGVLVFAVMQGVAAVTGVWSAPTPLVLFHYVVDHVFFFGVPVATVHAWALDRRAFGRPALAGLAS